MLVGFTQSPLRCFLCQVQSLTILPFTPLSLPLFPVGDALARSSAARSAATSASVCQVFVVRFAVDWCPAGMLAPSRASCPSKPSTQTLKQATCIRIWHSYKRTHVLCAGCVCVCVFFWVGGGGGGVYVKYLESAVYL
jgi:hypothetical protein